MADTITIELREEDAHINNNDGDFVVTLPESIPLYPDDVVEIKNIFIDALESNEGSIVIDDDTEVEVQFSNYVTNWDTTNIPARTYETETAGDQPDLEPYFACNKAVIPNMADVFAIGEIVIYRKNGAQGAWGRPPDQKPLILSFSYPDPTDTTKNIIKQIQLKYQNGSTDSVNFTFLTNPDLVPFFVKGQLGDLVDAPSIIKLLNPQDILPTDNIDTRTLIGGNSDNYRGLRTYENTYDGGNFALLTGFQVQRQGIASFGNDAKITFEYKDWRDGQTKQIQFTIDDVFTGAGFKTHNITPNIDCVIGGLTVSRPFTDPNGTMKYIAPLSFPQDCPLNELPFNINTQDGNNSGDFFMEKIITAPAQLDRIVNIKTQTVSFTVKAGKYPLPQLCELLTDNFTKVDLTNPVFDIFPSNNPFLLTVGQLRQQNNLSNVGAGDPQYFSRADGKSFFTYGPSPTPDPFVGTDQVAFIADATLNNKVKISAIHQNLLDIAGANATLAPVTQYAQRGDGKHVINGRNGGIVFTSMTPQSFFEQLGFSYDSDKTIIANSTHEYTVIAGVGYQSQSMPTDLGRYTTTSESGLSSAILKTNPYVFPSFNTAGSATSTNTEIVATNTIAQASESGGYFMVEVNGIPQTSMIGSKFESNRVQAVISRYNTIGSYTSAYSEGSIPNVYKGEPTMIGSFNVRILNSKGELSSDVQNKSCVFLSITRANKTPVEQNLIN